jgi:4Fe-4S ferredoxin
MFPKVAKVIDQTQIKIEQKYLVKKYELVLDRLRCTGCGVCSIVCPKDAILFGPAAANFGGKEVKTGGSAIELIDPNKCVYCGTCQTMCPFDAINVYEDGDKVSDETLKITERHALPTLGGKKVYCSRLKRDANVYWDGELKFTYQYPTDEKEFKKFFLNKCPGNCEACAKICPTDAITFKSAEDAWKTKEHVVVDKEKCIACGACANVCPQSLFTNKWTKIHFSGAYNDIFWSPIEKKLLEQKVVLADKK